MILQSHCCLLSLNDIDAQDTSYRLRPPSDSENDVQLQASIQKFGILQPPLLQWTGESHIILSGRKRIQVAEKLSLKEIPCLVIKERVDLFQLCEMILIHAQTGSRLSIVEQAVFFHKIKDRLQEEQALNLLPLLGIKAQPYKLLEFTTCLQLDQAAVNALHAGLIHRKTGLKLAQLPRKDQQTVTGLIEYFKLGGSKQQKLVTYAVELVMRTQRPFEDFVKQCRQEEDEKNDNRPQQASTLLHSLERLCFPNITAAEEKFRRFQRSLQLPENITLRHTGSFEDDRLTLSIAFDDQDSFLKGWKKIKKDL